MADDWKTHLEDALIAEAIFRSNRNGLHPTQCPNCKRNVGALIVNGPDERWTDVVCPACDHEWIEET